MSEGKPTPRWLTTGQAARRLGLTSETIRRRVASGDIPGYQIDDGGAWRIPGAWVDEQLAKTAPIRRKP